MDDNVADRDTEIDMLVAMSGATRLQAARALGENQGNVDSALTQLAATKPPPKNSHVGSTAKNEKPSSRLRQYDGDTEDEISKLPPIRKNTPPSRANFGYSPDNTAAEQMANQRNSKARDAPNHPTKTGPNNYIEVGMVNDWQMQEATDVVGHKYCIPDTTTASTRNPTSSRTEFPGAVAVGGIEQNDDDFTLTPDADEEQPAIFEAEAVEDDAPDRELLLRQMVLHMQEIETQLNQQAHVSGPEVVHGELLEEGDSSDNGRRNFGTGSKRRSIFVLAAVLLVLVAVVSTTLAVVFSLRTNNENDQEGNGSVVGGTGATPSPTTAPATAPPVASPTTSHPTSLPAVTTQPISATTESRSTFRATWGMDYVGSCLLEEVPLATLTCAGEADIILIGETEFANCAVTGASEITCIGNLGTAFYSVEFSCFAGDGMPQGAVASLDEESEDCLGGTPVEGTWVHGIQLFLMCDGEPQPIGTCDPNEATGPNNACSLGFSCDEGGCISETLTIPEVTSTVAEAICA